MEVGSNLPSTVMLAVSSSFLPKPICYPKIQVFFLSGGLAEEIGLNNKSFLQRGALESR